MTLQPELGLRTWRLLRMDVAIIVCSSGSEGEDGKLSATYSVRQLLAYPARVVILLRYSTVLSNRLEPAAMCGQPKAAAKARWQAPVERAIVQR
jgi:hypothetical protein